VKSLKHDERGLVAIVISFIIINVLAITVLGFSQLARREQRQALDRQLASQAYYAAESGINDAEKALRNGMLTTNKTNCTTPSLGDPQIDLDLSVASPDLAGQRTTTQYTCLLVDLETENILYSSVGVDSKFAEFTSINPATGLPQAMTHLRISWENDQGAGDPFAPPGNTFPLFSDWRNGGVAINAGVLRLSMTDLNGGAGAFNRNNLINNTFTGYFYPTDGPAGSSPGISFPANTGANQGVIVNSSCDIGNNAGTPAYPRHCNIDVTGLTGSRYFLRLKSFYRKSAVTITAYNGATRLGIRGAQARVDSTGRVADVLRRVQVRLPIRTGFDMPEGSIETGESLCKRLDVAPFYGIVNTTPPIPAECNP